MLAGDLFFVPLMTSSQDIDELARQAASALNRRAIPELETLCKQILVQDQTYPDAWFFLSVAAMERQRAKLAIELIDNALKLDRTNTEYLAQKARLHIMAGQREEALGAAEHALSLVPDKPVVLDTLGVVFSRLEAHERARDVLRLSVAAAPDNAQFQFNLASVEQFLGNAEAAEHYYRGAIERKPDFYRAYWALSELEKNESPAGRLASLEKLDKPGLSAQDSLYLGHSLAREYEKADDFDAAFQSLESGKAAIRKQLHYDVGEDRALFAALKASFPVAEVHGTSGAQNIFVLGMPRSGTTLVDRILNAHGLVKSLGEIQDFSRAVKQVSGSTSRQILDMAMIDKAGELDLAEIARLYLYAVGERSDVDDYTLDKLPLNFLYVGFILAALPAAKIVCLRRNPMDTILSNFRQLFAVNASLYNYHYDLADTARYFVLFDDLMKHWKTVYGDRFFEISYEALVAEPEAEVSALCAHVSVPFEPASLEFYQRSDAVSTASAMQVRQPIYRSAVDRWRRYGDTLRPAMAVLEEAGISYQA